MTHSAASTVHAARISAARVRRRAILGASKEASQPGGPNASGTKTIDTSHNSSMGMPNPSRLVSALDGAAVLGLRRLNGLFPTKTQRRRYGPTMTLWLDPAARKGGCHPNRPGLCCAARAGVSAFVIGQARTRISAR